MRRGYWTGFLMGGLLGMLAARVYGDRLMDTVLPGMVGHSPLEDGGTGEEEGEDEFSFRPRRRRRYRRAF